MYSISKEFAFSAAHRLDKLPADHPCSRIHGHNYVVTVVLAQARVMPLEGWIRDFGDLDKFKDHIDTYFDHRWLGHGTLLDGDPVTSGDGTYTTPAIGFNPTAENLAKHFYDIARDTYPETWKVGVSETPKTIAWYSNGA